MVGYDGDGQWRVVAPVIVALGFRLQACGWRVRCISTRRARAGRFLSADCVKQSLTVLCCDLQAEAKPNQLPQRESGLFRSIVVSGTYSMRMFRC